MKFSLVSAFSALASFAGLALAVDGTFGVVAIRSGSPIHFSPMNASGNKFWLHKGTTSSCPSEVVKSCPDGKETSFGLSDAGFLFLNTMVPGGQRVYVDPNGTVGFTAANSMNMPPGSIQDGWSIQDGGLTFDGGLLACPHPDGFYQVITGKSPFANKDCLGFKPRVEMSRNKGPAAWQYT